MPHTSASLNYLSRLLNVASMCPPKRPSLFYECWRVYFIVDAIIMMSGAWYCIFVDDLFTAVQASSIALGVANALSKVLFLGMSPKFPRILGRTNRIYSRLVGRMNTKELASSSDFETVERCRRFFKFMTFYFPTSILAALYKVHFQGSNSPLLIAAFYLPKMPHYAFNLIGQILIILPVWTVLIAYVVSLIALTSLICSFLKCLVCKFEDQAQRVIDPEIFDLHSEIIMLVEEINRSIGSLFFFEIVILSPLQSCFCAYGAIVGLKSQSIQGYYSTLLLICSFVLPFALSYSCQSIINEAERLHDSLFSLNWHERSPGERKDIIFLAMQTRRELTFNYRRQFAFNMERFCEYLQCMLSFVTLIKHLNS